MSLIDLFKGFHRTAIQQEFPPSTRVLFDTIVFELNEEFWPDSLVFSERDLMYLTGLKKTTLHDAKHFLTSRHVIECKPFKNKFAYRLGDEFLQLLQKGNRPVNRLPTDQSTDHLTDHLTDQSSRSNTQPTIINNKTEDRRLRPPAWGRASAGLSDDAFKVWAEEMPRPLTASEKYELANLEECHGFEKVKAAIIATRRDRYYPTFANFKETLLGKKKGGESNGKREREYARPPEYDFLDDAVDTPR